MKRALLHAAALVLPLLGLGGLWLTSDRASREGTEWDVPIQGYDPRDLLQGHYVQFRYDWPLPASASREGLSGYEPLCLTGAAPRIVSVRIRQPAETCSAFVREGEALEGRLYASQAEALRLQGQLQQSTLQGVVRFRLRPDGHITPIRITFRPRPPAPIASATPAP